MALDELLEVLRADATSESLAACVNRLWYQHGAIGRALELIDAHPDLVDGMTSTQRQFADRIRGTDALRTECHRLVPPRAPGPAYLAERRRVLYCAYSTPVYHSNGYSVRTQGIVSGMRQAGIDVSVVGRSGYPWDVTTEAVKPRPRRWVTEVDGVEYTHLPEGSLGTDAPDDYVLVAADGFVREARLRRPSVLHAASNYLNGLPALIAARRLGLPFVYEVRGLWEVTEASAKEDWAGTERYAAQAEMETFVCQEADAVLAITQEVKDELVRRGVAAEKIELLPNGVDPLAIQPLPADTEYRKNLGLREDVPVIGFAGSLVAYEGLEVMLQAARILRGRKVGFQIAIAGKGGVYNRLKEYKEKQNLGRHVRFVGRRPSEEMPRLLSCFDIVCCPRRSLPVTEMVSPLKPLEAFAAAKPVVLSDVAPHRAIVGEHGERGILAAPDSPRALADALQQLIEDPERRAAMGRAGRLWTVDERNWRFLGESVRDVYRRVVAEREVIAGRPEGKLRIGLIADEFTTETLRRSATVVSLDGERFEEQLRSERLDLLFVESAWNGNGGQWHRAVGWYSDEEDARIARVLEVCGELGVPTVFWNKEDPVHFERFKRTAVRCDHVLTTDADMIRPYLATARTTEGGRAVTASSLPFYAQPAIHNPLPGRRPVEPTIAYAGTYYGERYADRSAQLANLLRAARKHGLAVYDRQLAMPDSPYRFPDDFQADVRGALPYHEVIDSYKAHTANLNVNSVAYSPTMFSRRVVEIAACGGVVLSAWGRGVSETFDGVIPSTNNEDYWDALLGAWSRDPDERLAEAWLQMRAVHRAHTVDTALTILARTAGLAVTGPRLPSYGLELDPSETGARDAVAAQSVLPRAVLLTDADPDGSAARDLRDAGVPLVVGPGEARPQDVAWWGRARAGLARTWAEDLLTATRYGDWDRLLSRPRREDETGQPLALPVDGADTAHADRDNGLVHARVLTAHGDNRAAAAGAAPVAGLLLVTPARSSATTEHPTGEHARTSRAVVAPDAPGTVLVAGHDLKFARAWLEHLRGQGATLLLDEWEDHARHDEERSRELLDRADTVFCEWGLGNAVWYAQHVRPGQRLVVRVHAQELRRPYLRRIDHHKVSAYVFVGELMRDAAVRSHRVPREKTVVVPNYVLADELDLPKEPGAEHVLGMVGMVPRIKRIDLAAHLMEQLLEQDDRFRLRVKGKRPEDYAWMARREDEMAFYRAAYERIGRLNASLGAEAVVFDGHGDDMAQWYRGIGTAVSLSDLESFHLTLPDGAASGAAPISLAWPGADLIYPREWLVASVPEMAQRIAALAEDPAARASFTDRARDLARAAFDRPAVFSRLDDVLTGRPAESDGSTIRELR
ncbi:glycosyltransferase [Kocuria sp. M1R5S2]|uniref:glycosyltransferase n=1 Tax=Kocuria rhizosphaerae TaxID=3376285 RepID=UPI00378AEC52